MAAAASGGRAGMGRGNFLGIKIKCIIKRPAKEKINTVQAANRLACKAEEANTNGKTKSPVPSIINPSPGLASLNRALNPRQCSGKIMAKIARPAIIALAILTICLVL